MAQISIHFFFEKIPQVWAGNEDCQPVEWNECKLVDQKVPFKVPKITCENAGQIPYTDCIDAEKTQMALGMSCNVVNSVNCQPVTELKCKKMTYTEIQQKPEEECKDYLIWIPVQTIEHKKKCLLPDISTMLPPESHEIKFIKSNLV